MTRDVVTIDDLSDSEIQSIFSLTEEFLREMSTPDRSHSVRGRKTLAQNFILATLFYEASTRTRLSFESAMLRLGGQYLSSADPKTTSTAKGETIADTVRVVENYADLIVMRHPAEGAVRVAAEYSSIPVINAGDGGHEHPTQTLCDLFTLQREKGSLKDLNVMLWGDLKNGRTVHSLVYGLARFGARIIPAAADGLDLPEHVARRLRRDYDCVAVRRQDLAEGDKGGLALDVVYITPDKPHQRSLFTDVEAETPVRVPSNVLAKIDACYVTRLQRERMTGDSSDHYSVIDKQFLKDRRYKESRVMHPLPRVGELGYDMDNDERAVYFKQASYGVPVRMALIAALLELKPLMLAEHPPEKKHPVYERQTLRCANPACVTSLATEQRYLRPRFLMLAEDHHIVARCIYCEHEVPPPFIGRTHSHRYEVNHFDGDEIPHDIVLFQNEQTALDGGFRPRKEHRNPVVAH